MLESAEIHAQAIISEEFQDTGKRLCNVRYIIHISCGNDNGFSNRVMVIFNLGKSSVYLLFIHS